MRRVSRSRRAKGRAPLYPAYWWAHLKFTPINIKLTILPKKDRGTATFRRRSDQPQAFDIALRRIAKQAAVLAAELRGAFIAHLPSGATRVEVLVPGRWPA